MESVIITGESRSQFGKKANKSLRKEGKIPAVLYGGDEVNHFSTTVKDVKHLVYTPDFKLAEIQVDGKAEKAILKDIQFHPVTDEIVHIDFLRLQDNTTVKVEVPVVFRGVSPGVKNGGKLIQSLRKIKIKTTPENLVDELTVDISHVELGNAVRIRDLDEVEGIEVLNEGAIPIAIVEVPRVLKTEDEEAEELATAEGEEGAEGAAGEEGAAKDAPAEDKK